MKAFVSHTRLTAIILLFSLRIAPATDAAKMEDFIPNDSVVYLTLRDLDEVWEAIEVSENWEGVLASPKIKTQMDQVNQGANMLKLMLGIDLRGIIEMVGHQISLTVFPGEVGPMIGIIVNTSGAIREVERIVTGFAQMASASEDNSVEQNAGKYRKVEFSIVTLDELELTYGFVGDLLVVGVNPGSFEALIDTYRKQRESISKNDQFRDLYQQFAEAQVFVYTNVDLALPLVTADMDAQKEAEFRALGLDSLQTLVYSLDLLNVGGEHQLYAKIKPDQRQGILGSLLQEAQPLQSIQALSGKEDVFLSIAPSNAEAIWELIETVANTGDDSGGFYDGIAQVEALLNLNIKTDVVGALTGEVALWGTFTEGMAEDVHSLTDLLYEMDAAIIVALRSQAKWRTFLDSIQNLANMPIQQYDYKGTMLHQVSLPPEDPTMTVRYGYVKDLFLVSFSDERFELVVDNASAGRAVSTFKKKFKALPADPVIFLQLKLDKFLMAILASGEESIRLSADATKRLGEIGPLVASVSVKQNEAWLKVGTMSAEEPIETYGKLASAIVPAIIR